jgi:hypothetical protein
MPDVTPFICIRAILAPIKGKRLQSLPIRRAVVLVDTMD